MGWLSFTFLGAVVNGADGLLTKALSHRPDMMAIVGISFVIGGFIMVAQVVLFQKIPVQANAQFWGATLMLGLLTPVVNTLYVLAFRDGQASLVGPTWAVVTNVLLVVGGVLIWREQLTPLQMAGILCSLLGIFCMTYKP